MDRRARERGGLVGACDLLLDEELHAIGSSHVDVLVQKVAMRAA